eukprot:TRINITY_DN1137_c0_g1_i2.p1 TRINITY_DN1137_c0_g1~~TRINITY_DN1137_c0_g1_i2.p1  ORF type:complete len:149 (+),score=16.65 TRINITY_DN1137_c0_g1_i2:281-727(+)
MLAKATGVDAASVTETNSTAGAAEIGFTGVHHVGLLCENLERSLDFYCGLLGLEVNPARPSDKLAFRGVWLWVGEEMIHLLECHNPDPKIGRAPHGGSDRHTCLAVKSLSAIKSILDQAGLPYTMSQSGRAALFTRDPDSNALEFTQV